jgi:hypothetical protein
MRTGGVWRIWWPLGEPEEWRDAAPGAGQPSSGALSCRINAAFRLPSERRIYAAAKIFVMRPPYASKPVGFCPAWAHPAWLGARKHAELARKPDGKAPACNLSRSWRAYRPTVLPMKTGYLIDMDGVIYRENHLVPGAKDFVEALILSSAPFIFLTNNSAPTPEDLSVRLGHLASISTVIESANTFEGL